MNEKLTRRFAVLSGLSAIGAFVGSLLFFPRRSTLVSPHPTHLLDAPSTEGTFGESHDGKVLSSDQEFVREWYKTEYDVEPIYGEEGHIIGFVSDEGKDFDPTLVHDVVKESLEAGEFVNPVPEAVLREMERHGTAAAVGGADTATAATEAVGKTLH